MASNNWIENKWVIELFNKNNNNVSMNLDVLKINNEKGIISQKVKINYNIMIFFQSYKTGNKLPSFFLC